MDRPDGLEGFDIARLGPCPDVRAICEERCGGFDNRRARHEVDKMVGRSRRLGMPRIAREFALARDRFEAGPWAADAVTAELRRRVMFGILYWH